MNGACSLPQIRVKGDAGETGQRVKSLLNLSALQVSTDNEGLLKFRKVRLQQSRNLPLTIYGYGVVKFEQLEKGFTRVTYELEISRVTVFSFVLTGLSILIFLVFADYLLLTSWSDSVTEIIIPVIVVSVVSLSMMPMLVLSFLRTRKRAENFFRAFLEKAI
jgi:hypothetical protein